MKFGVVVFPGTWSDRDCAWVAEGVLKQPVNLLWHTDSNLRDTDCVILPGGFSFGDHLRAGAVARFSPIMQSVVDFAERGGLVWGICNGFQILCESGLLPGALIRNDSTQFRCEMTHLRCDNTYTAFTRTCGRGQVLRIPISHGEGSYYADQSLLDELEADNRVVFRYCDPSGQVTTEANPNGSCRNIAGITNRRGNVVGMMPHPERAVDPLLGSTDGLLLFQSALRQLTAVGSA